MKVYIEKTTTSAPKYACAGDAGMDIIASEDTIIHPGETKCISTNLKMAIPEGYEIQVRPRSGISLKTMLRVANAPGTIDSGYRDEIKVIMTNISRDYYFSEDNNINHIPNDYILDIKGQPIKDISSIFKFCHNHGTYQIKAGDRIAQIVLCKYEKIEFEPVIAVKEIGSDRGGGFGHTGVTN